MIKLINFILIFIVFFGCVSLNNKGLISNIDEIGNKEYILYIYSHFSHGSPIKQLPQNITQYLFIKEFDSTRSRFYFQLYKYSNYSPKVKLRDVSGPEYENISNILNRINQGEDVMCIKSSEYSTNIKFRFIINLDSNYKKVDELYLIPHEIDLLKKYDCLEEYLKMILFFREYEATTNFNED